MKTVRIIGIDPSIVACGWGVIDKTGNKITHVGHGVIRPPRTEPLPSRLHFIFAAITELIQNFGPSEAGVEDAFMTNNAMSALKLGQARAACILAATSNGLNVGEYAARAQRIRRKSPIWSICSCQAQM